MATDKSQLSIGTLFGALIAAPIANMRIVGRKYSVCLWCFIFSIGMIIQISSSYPHWYQLMIGRIVSGSGVGALSVIVPMVSSQDPTYFPASPGLQALVSR